MDDKPVFLALAALVESEDPKLVKLLLSGVTMRDAVLALVLSFVDTSKFGEALDVLGVGEDFGMSPRWLLSVNGEFGGGPVAHANQEHTLLGVRLNVQAC